MNHLAALRDQADQAAATIAATPPDLYDRPVEDPERAWAVIVRLELDELAAALVDLRDALDNDLHEEHR